MVRPRLCEARRFRGEAMPRRERSEAEAGWTKQGRSCARGGGAEAMRGETEMRARRGKAGPRRGQGEVVEMRRGAEARRIVVRPSRGVAGRGVTEARPR